MSNCINCGENIQYNEIYSKTDGAPHCWKCFKEEYEDAQSNLNEQEKKE